MVLNDTFEGESIVVVYEAIDSDVRRGATAIPFSATVNGRELTFTGHRVP